MTVDFNHQVNQLDKEISALEKQIELLTMNLKDINEDIVCLADDTSQKHEKLTNNPENEENKTEFYHSESKIAAFKLKKANFSKEVEDLKLKLKDLITTKENILSQSLQQSDQNNDQQKAKKTDQSEIDQEQDDVSLISEDDVVEEEIEVIDRKEHETSLNLMLSKEISRNGLLNDESDTQSIEIKEFATNETENDTRANQKTVTTKLEPKTQNTEKIRTSKISVNTLTDEDKIENDPDMLYSQGKITEFLDLHFAKISEQSVGLAKVTIEKILKFTNNQVENLNKTVTQIESQLKEIAGKMIGFQKHMNNLTTAFNQKFIGDKTKDDAFNKLYESMRDYKDNFLFKAQKPVFMDLILLYDDIQKMIEQQTNEKKLLELISDMIKEILYRNDVTIMSFDDNKFDSKFQKAIRRIDTDKPENDRLVAEVLKQGFKSCDMIIRPQEVVVYKYEKTAENKDS